MSTDILFTPTPKNQDEATNLRRYRAAKAVAEALGEPIDNFLRDWSPAHIHLFVEMDRRAKVDGNPDDPDIVYFCPKCESTRLGFVAPAEFEFDGEDHSTDFGIDVQWDGETKAYCCDCSTDFVLGDSFLRK